MILLVESFDLTIHTPPSNSNNAFKSSFHCEEHEERRLFSLDNREMKPVEMIYVRNNTTERAIYRGSFENIP